jgi:hypothetical protein
MGYIYSSSLESIQVQLLKLNCPYPLNSANATNLGLDGTIVTYNVTHDTSSSDYHVTVFHCGEGDTVNVYNTVYTTANNWYLVAGQAGGYIFYIAESITEFFLKVVALGTLVQLFINSPAEVLAIPQYVYVNVVLIAFIGIGGFMVVRG